MKDSVAILRRVGWFLVIVGVIDIFFMIYCAASRINYSSSFNILAVIAGIFLLKGSLRAARVISFFVAFFIGCDTGGVLFAPFLTPIDLTLISIRLNPTSYFVSTLYFIVSLAVLIWVYRELTSAPLRAAMDEAGIDYKKLWKRPSRGFWMGGVLALIVFLLVPFFLNGSMSKKIYQRAALQIGKGYKLHIQSLHITSHFSGPKQVDAVVTAYNDAEIKNVVVQWSE